MIVLPNKLNDYFPYLGCKNERDLPGSSLKGNWSGRLPFGLWKYCLPTREEAGRVECRGTRDSSGVMIVFSIKKIVCFLFLTKEINITKLSVLELPGYQNAGGEIFNLVIKGMSRLYPSGAEYVRQCVCVLHFFFFRNQKNEIWSYL